jgi:hypothetical protein
MKRLAASTLVLALAAPALAQDQPGAVALTVYSTARPGAIPADLYRPVPTAPGYAPPPQPVPGYAVVKQERQVTLDKGQSTGHRTSRLSSIRRPWFSVAHRSGGTSVGAELSVRPSRRS